jgi:hypothetical protein
MLPQRDKLGGLRERARACVPAGRDRCRRSSPDTRQLESTLGRVRGNAAARISPSPSPSREGEFLTKLHRGSGGGRRGGEAKPRWFLSAACNARYQATRVADELPGQLCPGIVRTRRGRVQMKRKRRLARVSRSALNLKTKLTGTHEHASFLMSSSPARAGA